MKPHTAFAGKIQIVIGPACFFDFFYNFTNYCNGDNLKRSEGGKDKG